MNSYMYAHFNPSTWLIPHHTTMKNLNCATDYTYHASFYAYNWPFETLGLVPKTGASYPANPSQTLLSS